jgi:hypothetical protein
LIICGFGFIAAAACHACKWRGSKEATFSSLVVPGRVLHN